MAYESVVPNSTNSRRLRAAANNVVAVREIAFTIADYRNVASRRRGDDCEWMRSSRSLAIHACRPVQCEIGASPFLTIVAAASFEDKNLISATAASECSALEVNTPANANPGCSTAGIGPTTVTPSV